MRRFRFTPSPNIWWGAYIHRTQCSPPLLPTWPNSVMDKDSYRCTAFQLQGSYLPLGGSHPFDSCLVTPLDESEVTRPPLKHLHLPSQALSRGDGVFPCLWLHSAIDCCKLVCRELPVLSRFRSNEKGYVKPGLAATFEVGRNGMPIAGQTIVFPRSNMVLRRMHRGKVAYSTTRQSAGCGTSEP